jgi:hypothetical protein
VSTSIQAVTAERRAGRRLPDFFIVGHPKSGTTALYEMLRQHPQIYMPAIKEPRFFASDMRPRFQPPRSHVLPRTLEEYLALFDGALAGQRVGEASPSYLWSRTAARRIAEMQPGARIIAILREPTSFLRSLHLEFLRSHVETERDLGKAIALQDARRQGRRVPRRSHRPQLLQYTDQVRYVDQLRRFHERFPREQVLVLIYEDFRADNQATLQSVLRFLDVDQRYPITVKDVHPTTHGMRAHAIDDLVYSVSLGHGPLKRAARSALRVLASRRLRRGAFRAVRRRIVLEELPEPDPRLLSDLRRRFKPEVLVLSEYLGRDLVRLWGYEQLD